MQLIYYLLCKTSSVVCVYGTSVNSTSGTQFGNSTLHFAYMHLRKATISYIIVSAQAYGLFIF